MKSRVGVVRWGWIHGELQHTVGDENNPIILYECINGALEELMRKYYVNNK